MNSLTERAFERSRSGIFSFSDVLVWLGEGRARAWNLVLRAVADGDVIRVRRGLYCLAPKFNRAGVNRFALANLAYGPSCVSMESALSWHGWIPEAVHAVTSACLSRSRSFDTPLGPFDYVHVAQSPLLAGVERVEEDGALVSFLVARPLKAIADCVAARRLDWRGAGPLEESLRIDAENLETLSAVDFDELDGAYKARRVRVFLESLRKELGK